MSNWKEPFVRWFLEGTKQSAVSMLGVEIEHFILDNKNRAVPYSGEKGVRQILLRLMALYPDAEIIPDDDFFGFSVPEFTVTLEPASQLELSISPTPEIRRIGQIYREFRRNLDAVLEAFGYSAVSCGCQPESRAADLELIPKKRYGLMHEYFKGTGTGGAEMMRGTASLQVSVDYHSESDFRRKIQAAFYYSPVFKLLCDNASSFQGIPLQTCLKRTDIWRRVDPDRCGILPGIFDSSYGFADYADFLGAMPPIFLKYGHQVLPTGDKTVAELFSDKEPDKEETAHILSMAFPDVRLKSVLEIRFADSVPLPFMLAYCSLVKGLIYSEEGLAHAEEQIVRNDFSETAVLQAEDDIMKNGWQAAVYGCRVGELAEQWLALAQRNLSEEEGKYLEAFYITAEYGGIRAIPEEKYRLLRDDCCECERTEDKK